MPTDARGLFQVAELVGHRHPVVALHGAVLTGDGLAEHRVVRRLVLAEESRRVRVGDVREARAHLAPFRVHDALVDGAGRLLGAAGCSNTPVHLDGAIGRLEQIEVRNIAGKAAIREPGHRILGGGRCQGDGLLSHALHDVRRQVGR